MAQIRSFAADSDNQILVSMNGLRLELSGPKTHPLRTVVWLNKDDEWRITLDEMLAPEVFLHRNRTAGAVFDEERPDGEMIEQWTDWKEDENEELNEMLLKFIETKEGFHFLLAMD